VLLSLAVAWVLSIPSILSFNVIAGVHPANALPGFEAKTIFDLIDYVTANILLPVSGLLIAIFCAWTMKQAATRDELRLGDSAIYSAWLFLMRFVVPVSIVIIFVNIIWQTLFAAD
jgi:NSS family neurotransmitter:Na+ symporter